MFGSHRIIQPPKGPVEIFAAADADIPPKSVSVPTGAIRDALKPPFFGAKINGDGCLTSIINNLVDGWGARIRTWEWRNQNPLPYHLATPHQDRSDAAPGGCLLHLTWPLHPVSTREAGIKRRGRGDHTCAVGNDQRSCRRFDSAAPAP